MGFDMSNLRRCGKFYLSLLLNIESNMQKLNKERYITDVEFLGIDHSDAPDYVDAYIVSASWSDGKALTDEELDELNDDKSQVYDLLMDHLH